MCEGYKGFISTNMKDWGEQASEKTSVDIEDYEGQSPNVSKIKTKLAHIALFLFHLEVIVTVVHFSNMVHSKRSRTCYSVGISK